MMKTPPRVPDLLLEKLALGELDPAQADQVRRRLAAEPDGEQRLAALTESNREILAAYPARKTAASIDARLARAQRPRRSLINLPALATATAALLVVIVWLAGPFRTTPPDTPVEPGIPTERIKGDPQVIVHLKKGGSIRQIFAGDALTAGDTLQLSYLAGGAKYGVIFSVDGRGTVTLHFPAHPDDPTELAEGAAHPLPFSYELDDAPDFERFIFITADEPLDVRQVLAWGEELGADRTKELALPENMQSFELTIDKIDEAKGNNQ